MRLIPVVLPSPVAFTVLKQKKGGSDDHQSEGGRCACCRASARFGGRQRRGAKRISGPRGQGAGRLSAGRPGRHLGTRRQRPAVGDLGPAGGGREHYRRQRQHRGRSRRQIRARRIYAAGVDQRPAGRQSQSLQDAVQPRDRSDADLARGLFAQYSRGAQ